MRYRVLGGMTLILCVFCAPWCVTSCGKSPAGAEVSFYKSFNREKQYEAGLPASYRWTDYRAIAEMFHDMVFDFNAKGGFLPLAWRDLTYGGIGIPAYVGDGRMGQDGAEEAVTLLAALQSACLNGFDTRGLLSAANAFFSESEGIVLNNPGGSSASTSMWYLLYPAILYTRLARLTGDTVLLENSLTTIENWYEAYQIIRERGDDFDITGFNFVTRSPWKNNVWKEPDCAAGMAVLFYAAYTQTGGHKYLDAAVFLVDWLDAFFGGPLYELLLYYEPALLAVLNDFHDGTYDISRALNRVFDGDSIPRGGWGSVAGVWGDYPVNGLFGSKTDRGGYAFAMNTFAAAGALAPLVRYDTRYARSIGRWLLNLHANSRYFFSGEVKRDNQSLYQTGLADSVSESLKAAVPYEGIIKTHGGKSPWFGGDPTINGWAATDLSLYSGAHTGILGAVFTKTNQEGIIKIDLSAADFFLPDAWPAFLLYNPYSEARSVDYTRATGGSVDLFDAVSNTTLVENVSDGVTALSVPGNGALVVVEIPAGLALERRGHALFAGGRYVSSEQAAVNFTVEKRGGGSIEVKPELLTNAAGVDSGADNPDTIDVSYTLFVDNQEFNFTGTLVVDARDFTPGTKQFRLVAHTTGGLSDSLEQRITLPLP